MQYHAGHVTVTLHVQWLKMLTLLAKHDIKEGLCGSSKDHCREYHHNDGHTNDAGHMLALICEVKEMVHQSH